MCLFTIYISSLVRLGLLISLAHFLNWLICFLFVKFKSYFFFLLSISPILYMLCVFWRRDFYHIYVLQIFSSQLWLSSHSLDIVSQKVFGGF